MFITLKVLHLLALMFGSASAFGNIYLGIAKGLHDPAAPKYTKTLQKFFRRTSLIAIIVLWVTGLILFVSKYGGKVEAGAFHGKMAFAILLTLIVLFTNFMAPKWAKRDGPPSYMPALSWVSAITLITIAILAVMTFA